MLEAVGGAALRVVLDSAVLGGILALCILAGTRALLLAASTRHALWLSTLVAMGAMPFAGLSVSLARAHPAPHAAHAASMPAAGDVSRRSVRPAVPLRRAVAAEAGRAATVPDAVPPRASFALAAAAMSSAERTLLATPRVSRAVALAGLGVWLAGAAIGIGGLIAGLVRLRGLKRRSSPLEAGLADELPWLTAVSPGREIYLRLSFEIETPVAIGFRRPVILIPTELAAAGGLAAIEPLVLHEYAHLRRYDDWTNLAQRAIERVFWFNPLVWLVGRRIALERELASDDAVVEKTGEPHAYATSLWRLAREMRMPEHAVVAPGALLTRRQISIRIEQLLAADRRRFRRSTVAGLASIAAAGATIGLVAAAAPTLELPAARSAHGLAQRHPGHAAVAANHAVVPAKRLAAAASHASPAGALGDASRRPATTGAAQRHGTAATIAARVQRVVILVPPSRPLHLRAAASPPEATTGVPTVPAAPDPDDALHPPAVPAPPNAPASHAAGMHGTKSTVRIVRGSDGIAEIAAAAAGDALRDVHEALANLPAQINAEVSTASRTRTSIVDSRRMRLAACPGCSLRGAYLRGIDLHGLALEAVDLSGADLRGADLSNARILGGSLLHANLTNADLRGARFIGTDLRGAILDNALLQDVQFAGVVWKSVSLRGTIVRYALAGCSGCDFSYANLRGQDLHGITLQSASLSHADLRDANLAGVRFVAVDLSHASAAGADLSDARFENCNVVELELDGANISGFVVRPVPGADG